LLDRDVYSEEHELFRAEFRRFAAAEIAPRIEAWNREGKTDKATWRRVGEAGAGRVRRRGGRFPLRRGPIMKVIIARKLGLE
jgi:alkylation response protein AidB-like acyl-CoA dehydrogenase